jgi:hypothetical protein
LQRAERPLPTLRKKRIGEKTKNGQRRRSEIEATLQQGLQLRAERSAAGQFWTFTMSNSKTLVGYVSRTFKAREEELESLRPLPPARSIVRAHASARVMRPPSLLRRTRLSAPRLRARDSATREDGVIRWWSDNDRAGANDWRQQRVVRASPRQQIGSLTCGVDAGHCGSLLPFGGGFSARRRLVRLSRIASGLLPMRQATRFRAHNAPLARSLERPDVGGAERGYGCA